jgi:hypothetical protein
LELGKEKKYTLWFLMGLVWLAGWLDHFSKCAGRMWGACFFFLFSFALCVCPAKSKGMDGVKSGSILAWQRRGGNMVWRGVAGKIKQEERYRKGDLFLV